MVHTHVPDHRSDQAVDIQCLAFTGQLSDVPGTVTAPQVRVIHGQRPGTAQVSSPLPGDKAFVPRR